MAGLRSYRNGKYSKPHQIHYPIRVFLNEFGFQKTRMRRPGQEPLQNQCPGSAKLRSLWVGRFSFCEPSCCPEPPLLGPFQAEGLDDLLVLPGLLRYRYRCNALGARAIIPAARSTSCNQPVTYAEPAPPMFRGFRSSRPGFRFSPTGQAACHGVDRSRPLRRSSTDL